MVDIFISCEQEDREAAKRLMQTLRIVGYAVTADFEALPSGQSSISEAPNYVKTTKVVLTLWTTRSIHSSRVINESRTAQEDGRYIGVIIENNVHLPPDFEGFQCAEMTGHSTEPEEFDWLCGAIDAVISIRNDMENASKSYDDASFHDAESAVWHEVSKADNVVSYDFYLDQYGRKGLYYDKARERRHLLTGWSYRLGRFTDKAWVKGMAAAAMVLAIGNTIAVSQNASRTVSHSQYATLIEDKARLQADLDAANDSRLRLIASFGQRVSREQYATLDQQTRELKQELQTAKSTYEEKLAFAFDAVQQSGKNDPATASAQDSNEGISPSASGLTWPAKIRIEPASASEWSCNADGVKGVRFASRCWARNTHVLSLAGAGLEHATSLEPVEYLRALDTLEVAGGYFQTLEPLASLRNLRSLDVSEADIASIKPLKSLTGLEFLDVSNTHVVDLSPLGGMHKLSSFCPPVGACIFDNHAGVQRYLDEHARN